MTFAHLAARLFNAPHAIEAGKLDVIAAALAPRLGFAGLDPAALALPTGRSPARRTAPEPNAHGVAVIPVHGTLVQRTRGVETESGLRSYEAIRRDLDTAMADADTAGVLLDVDSPGGEVAGVFALVDAIAAARTRKPVVAFVNEVAFSAGYALASAADRVVLPEPGGVGSVGVVALHADQSAKNRADGYALTHVFAGARKIDHSPHRPLSADGRARLQAEVDRLHGLFVEAVARARNLSPAVVRNTEAALFYGDEAVRAGLADRVGGEDDAFAVLSGLIADRKAGRASSRSPAPRAAARQPRTTRMEDTAPAPAALEVARACEQAGFPELTAGLLAAGLDMEAVNRRLDDAHHIRETAALCGLPHLGRELVAAGAAMGDALARIRAAKAATQEGPAIDHRHTGLNSAGARVSGGRMDTYDNPAFRVEAMADGMMVGLDPTHTPSPAGAPFANASFTDAARHCLGAVGRLGAGMSGPRVLAAALNTTSDFPLLLGEFYNKALRTAYEAAVSGIKDVARRTTAQDFRDVHRIAPGEFPTLSQTNEAGEFISGTIGEEGGVIYRVATYGRIVGFARQVLFNDDKRAFGTMVQRTITGALNFEAGQIAALVNGNPALWDGKAVFHADHHNLATAASPINVAGLSDARRTMRNQKGVDGQTFINVVPRFIVCGADRETEAEQAVGAIVAGRLGDVNPFANALNVVADPRLAPSAWYVAGDPARVEGLEYAYLADAPGPVTETEQGFDYDGVRFKVRLDFGCGWADYRGWFKNPGA